MPEKVVRYAVVPGNAEIAENLVSLMCAAIWTAVKTE